MGFIDRMPELDWEVEVVGGDYVEITATSSEGDPLSMNIPRKLAVAIHEALTPIVEDD